MFLVEVGCSNVLDVVISLSGYICVSVPFSCLYLVTSCINYLVLPCAYPHVLSYLVECFCLVLFVALYRNVFVTANLNDLGGNSWHD